MPSLISLVYRTVDMLKWGAGKGSNVLPAETDNNNWTIAQAILSIQNSLPSASVGIDFFTVSGTQMTVHMTDHSLRGPFTLPTFQWVFRNPPSGQWEPFVLYDVGDVFTDNGSVYLTLIQSVSGASFNANALDVHGNNLYGLLLVNPGDVLPLGGASGMALIKVDGHDLHVEWAYVIPPGGTTGQSLKKINNFDFNTHWATDLLTTLGDVIITTPVVNDVLSWDGAHWINAAAITALQNLSDVLISGQNVGQALIWNGTAWQNTTIITSNQTITPLGTTGSIGFDPSLGDIFTITPTGNVTLTGVSAGLVNQIIKLIVLTSGTSSFNITFGTGFVAQGVLATGTVSGKTFIVSFINDGNFYYEMSRTAAM